MKFLLSMPPHSCPPDPEFLHQDAIMQIAVLAEEVGFAGAFFTEHPIPGEAWRQSGGHDALDPFIGLSYVAAATKRLQLLTHLIVLPYRNPFLVAKSAATLDALSGGRLILGVGVGYQAAEFEALGVAYDERNQLFDEALAAIKLAWTGKPITFQGKHFAARDVTAQPIPAQRPHPPIWIGGNAKITLRRVAEVAQGWLVLPSTPEQAQYRNTAPLNIDTLGDKLEELHLLAASAGRTDAIQINYPIVSHRHDDVPSEMVVDIGRLAGMGVQWCSWTSKSSTLSGTKHEIRRFGDEVISKFPAA